MICRNFDSEIVKMLLGRRGDQIRITEDVVKAAASNWVLEKWEEVMTLDRRDDDIQVLSSSKGNSSS
jgi:hypothetical protein